MFHEVGFELQVYRRNARTYNKFMSGGDKLLITSGAVIGYPICGPRAYRP